MYRLDAAFQVSIRRIAGSASASQSIIAALEHRLFQTVLKKDQQDALQEFLDSKTKMTDADIAETIRLMMSTPEYQVT